MFGAAPLVPVYGRDYKSRKAMLADLNANKDFRTAGGAGPVTNLADLREMGITGSINVRSADLCKVWVVEIGTEGEAK